MGVVGSSWDNTHSWLATFAFVQGVDSVSATTLPVSVIRTVSTTFGVLSIFGTLHFHVAANLAGGGIERTATAFHSTLLRPYFATTTQLDVVFVKRVSADTNCPFVWLFL